MSPFKGEGRFRDGACLVLRVGLILEVAVVWGEGLVLFQEVVRNSTLHFCKVCLIRCLSYMVVLPNSLIK